MKAFFVGIIVCIATLTYITRLFFTDPLNLPILSLAVFHEVLSGPVLSRQLWPGHGSPPRIVITPRGYRTNPFNQRESLGVAGPVIGSV